MGKTPQGAIAHFEGPSQVLPETNMFFRLGSNPNEMRVKDSHTETTWTRWTRDDGEKRSGIEKLFQLSGMDKYVMHQNGLLMASLRAGNTNVPEETWKRLEQTMELRAAREEIIAAYDHYYTLEEIKALNAFYGSPVGKKELTTRPLMLQQVSYILGGRTDKIAALAAEESKKK